MEQILASIRELVTGEQPGAGNTRESKLHFGKATGEGFELMDDLSNGAVGTIRTALQSAENQDDPMLSDSSRKAIGRAFETLDQALQQYSNFAGGSLEPVFTRAVQEAVTPTLQTWVETHEAPLLQAVKPLMREWMDANLPRSVESVLKEELARAVTEHLRSRLG